VRPVAMHSSGISHLILKSTDVQFPEKEIIRS
jgi:hypothetical protein